MLSDSECVLGRNSHVPLTQRDEKDPQVSVYFLVSGPGHTWHLMTVLQSDAGSPALGVGVRSWGEIKSQPLLPLMMNMLSYADELDLGRESCHRREERSMAGPWPQA